MLKLTLCGHGQLVTTMGNVRSPSMGHRFLASDDPPVMPHVLPVRGVVGHYIDRYLHYIVSSSSCSWPAVRGVVYAIIALVQSYVYLHMHTVLTGNLDYTEHAVSSLCSIISHDCDIKHTCMVG